MNEKIKTFGLRDLPKDERDFSLGAIISPFPKLEELPKNFELAPIDLKTQIDDFCSGNTTALLIGTNENKAIDENWMFAKSKELSGDADEWGQNMRVAMQVGVKIGALPKENSPFTSEEGSDFLRRIENWPQGLDFFASPQKQKTFFSVTGPYSVFDNVRASMYFLAQKGQQQGTAIGVSWGWALEEYLLNDIREGFGHMLTGTGWREVSGETYLVLQNSYGKAAGKEGKHLISRNVINHFADRFGVMMFVDMPREQAEYLLNKNLNLRALWWVKPLLAFKKYLNVLLA